jgi:hypothetical protein
MNAIRFVLLCFCATAALQPFRLAATTVEPQPFDTLVTRADYIVRGVVKSSSSEWRESKRGQRYIATKVEVEVLEVLRGTPPSPLVLDMLGGKVDDVELVVDGAPKFNVGDEDILFIKDNGRTLSPLVGIMHGRYPVLREATSGKRYAVRSNGMPLYSEHDVARPMGQLSLTKVANPRAAPISVDTFVRRIRESSDRHPRTTTHEQ